MPSINCESAREELFKCLAKTEAVTKNNQSIEETLELPAESFPSECADLKRAFEECVKNAEKEKD